VIFPERTVVSASGHPGSGSGAARGHPARIRAFCCWNSASVKIPACGLTHRYSFFRIHTRVAQPQMGGR
jgi:hypothetical protein